jgi:hypothetical protein
MVSIEQVAAQAQTVVGRARSLFGSAGAPNAVAPPLESAAQRITGTSARAAGMSGDAARQHRRFAGNAAAALTHNGATDASLHHMLGAAATTTRGAARQLDSIADHTRTLAQASVTARSPAAQRSLLAGLRTQVSAANSVVSTTQQQANTLAAQIRALDYRTRGPVHGASVGQDQSPKDRPPSDPPHGQDPRYWIDVTKIITVPDGQKAPYATKQIGPGLYYPFDDGLSMSGPPPAKWPLDTSQITRLEPGLPGPYATSELAPGIFAPDPRQTYGEQPPWPAPQQPIDVRDVIHLGEGQQAPRGYVEYLSGWWAPAPPPTR